MEKSKFRLLLVAALCVGMFGFMSCGGNDNSSDPEPVNPNPTDTTSTTKGMFDACEYRVYNAEQWGLVSNAVLIDLYNNDSTAGYVPEAVFWFTTTSVDGTGLWEKETYTDEKILPNNASYLYLNANDSFPITNINITVEPTDEIDIYKISGSFTANDSTYNFSYTGFADNAYNYRLEDPTPVTKKYTFGSATYVYRERGGYHWLYVYLDEVSMLQFWVTLDSNTILPVGTYPITYMIKAGTSMASAGRIDTYQEGLGVYIPEDYADFIGDENEGVWYLRKGTIEVSLQEGSTNRVIINGRRPRIMARLSTSPTRVG